jgi:hypothetical protein
LAKEQLMAVAADDQDGALLQGLLGYLNFSEGRPDPRFQKQLNDVLAGIAEPRPWDVLRRRLAERLAQLRGSGPFANSRQVEAVIDLAFDRVLSDYRRHHRDLLFHQSDEDLFQPFFLVRVCEAVLGQGGPWDETERIVTGTLKHLNDFAGHRPIALLETRPQGEPYDHERVRPVPLWIRDAGVATSRYHDLVERALEFLAAADAQILAEAQFDLAVLSELAFDPRAYDHGHPANRRPNHMFGEYDSHHLDSQGRHCRYVIRQIVLDALLERVTGTPLAGTEARPAEFRQELLFEAAAVLAGTILMTVGSCGPTPHGHDSTTTLHVLTPRIAQYRDRFYAGLLATVGGGHGERLRAEQATLKQPLAGARQHLNQYLAAHRAAQLQHRHLALLFADMGFPDAARQQAAKIPSVAVRILSELLAGLSTCQLLIDRADLARAATVLPEIEELLRRGIDCGALVDPWNILGFQGLYPLSPAREDSIRDPRCGELIHVMERLLFLHSRLLSEAAAAGRDSLVTSLRPNLQRLAAWWDRFATYEVADVLPLRGGEIAESAEHVARALTRWRERGEAVADLGFWKGHLENFRSPKAFALVIDALLRKHDLRAAMGLLMSWLSQADTVALEEAEHSFHTLALRWMLGAVGQRKAPVDWPLLKRFFEALDANAEDFMQVSDLGAGVLIDDDESEEDADDDDDDDEASPFEAAYEGVTFRDSADDDEDSAIADGSGSESPFELHEIAAPLGERLRFLTLLSRLWIVVARAGGTGPARTETLRGCLDGTPQLQTELWRLLDAIQEFPVPEPSGAPDGFVEFEKQRRLKEQLLYQAIDTCHNLFLAIGALQSSLDAASPGPGMPEWHASAVQLEKAVLRGDRALAQQALPEFLARFRHEPLLFTVLADGGQPRDILRTRIAHSVLRALVTSLPRLGLLRETYQVLKTVRLMEDAHRPTGRGESEFRFLFQAAYKGIVEALVESSKSWQGASERTLLELLEAVTGPCLTLWVEHSQSLNLSVLESVADDAAWERMRDFIRRYGHDLFEMRFLEKQNLNGVLHRGLDAFLDHLRDNPDPLHPIQLIEDLEQTITRPEAVRQLQIVLQALVDNYEEYKDYNTTTPHSDYGENLHLLLDFLRLKVRYQRHAWQFRPLTQAHEVLARAGQQQTALAWEEAFIRYTRELTAEHLAELARLEQVHGTRLRTVADLVGERLFKTLAVDRFCALVEPAMTEAAHGGPAPAFEQLAQGLQAHAAMPTGVGLDVPQWLRRLETEVQRTRATRSTVAVLAEEFLKVPRQALTLADVRQQLTEWEKPLGDGSTMADV